MDFSEKARALAKNFRCDPDNFDPDTGCPPYCGEDDDYAVEKIIAGLKAAYEQGREDMKHVLMTEGG